MRYASLACAVGVLWCIAVAAPAAAQAVIGDATAVENSVSGVVRGKPVRIGLGDSVYRDQQVRTARDSRAKLTFLDQTNLSIGPESTVTLDDFVYRGRDGVTFNATLGAFRFVSGAAGGHNYQVQTPQAIIGVRGTNFGVRVQKSQTTIVLNEGAIVVCLRSRRDRCLDMVQPRTSVIVTTRAISAPFAVTQTAWTFDKTCEQSSSREICGRTVTEVVQPPALKPPFVNDGQQRGVGGRDPAGGRNLGGGRSGNNN
jgi:hypothetical protein